MSRKLRTVLIVMLTLIFVSSVICIAKIEIDYQVADNIYEKSRSEHFHVLDQPTLTGQEQEDGSAEQEPHFPDAYADIRALQEINPEVIGWMWIPDTSINYPILRGTDNRKYLNRSFDLKRIDSGSIFMDYRNAADYSDDNTIIYGHNMKNGSMFGSLKKYSDLEFLKNHSDLYLLTENQILKYRIFAAYQTENTSKSYTTVFSDGVSYESYLNYIISCAGNNLVHAPEEELPILMLSTCTSRYRSERFVVHAVFVAEKTVITDAS